MQRLSVDRTDKERLIKKPNEVYCNEIVLYTTGEIPVDAFGGLTGPGILARATNGEEQGFPRYQIAGFLNIATERGPFQRYITQELEEQVVAVFKDLLCMLIISSHPQGSMYSYVGAKMSDEECELFKLREEKYCGYTSFASSDENLG